MVVLGSTYCVLSVWRFLNMTDKQLEMAMEFSHPITPAWIQEREETEIVL